MKRELPDGWTWVKLGDVAWKVRHTVKDHAEEGIEWAVRGEDFESGSLRLGGRTPVDQVGPTFVKRFEPGHVLFMTRRAYLRKAAVADFTGVVANTTEVLEAKPDRLLPELFPFVLQSDAFVDYAVEMSVGSTNPYVKWTDLKRFEMPLPPMDRQRELVEVFRGVEDAIIKGEDAIEAAEVLFESVAVKLFSRGLGNHELEKTSYGNVPADWRVAPLGSCSTVQTGLTLGKKYKGRETVEMPYLRVANVYHGFFDLEEVKTVELLPEDVDRYLLRDGDVLLTEGGDADKLGRGHIWRRQIDPCLHQNHLFCVRPDSDVLLPEFFNYLKSSPYGKRFFLINGKQTTNLATINSTQLKQFPCLVPSLDEQREIVRVLDQVVDEQAALQTELRRLGRLKRAVLTSSLQPSQEAVETEAAA